MGERLLLDSQAESHFVVRRQRMSFSDSGEATEGGAGGSCLFRPFPGVVFRGSPPHLRRRHLHPRTRPAGAGPQAAPRGGGSHHPGMRMGRTGEVPGRGWSRDDTSFFLARRCAPPWAPPPSCFPVPLRHRRCVSRFCTMPRCAWRWETGRPTAGPRAFLTGHRGFF